MRFQKWQFNLLTEKPPFPRRNTGGSYPIFAAMPLQCTATQKSLFESRNLGRRSASPKLYSQTTRCQNHATSDGGLEKFASLQSPKQHVVGQHVVSAVSTPFAGTFLSCFSSNRVFLQFLRGFHSLLFNKALFGSRQTAAEPGRLQRDCAQSCAQPPTRLAHF